MKQIQIPLQIFFVLCIFLQSPGVSAQLSLKKPLICHNKENELKYYDDGSFKLHFEHGRFSSFITSDSAIKFLAEGRFMELTDLSNAGDPVKIQLAGNSIVFTHSGKSIIIDSIKTTSLIINNIVFSLYKNQVNYTVAFSINTKMVYLDIDIIGYPKKKWTWDMISINQDSSSFYFGYNPFYDGGPSMISRQDQRLRYGISIANSFKTNKYLWYIKPVFYEETEKSHVINILPDFYYQYNRKGKLKPRKCVGEIRYCDTE